MCREAEIGLAWLLRAAAGPHRKSFDLCQNVYSVESASQCLKLALSN
jgi:hypothetical protein